MGIMVGLPSPSGSEKDLQLNFGKNMTVQVEMRAPHLPAEWHMQSGIQLTWPHAGTDWAYMLAEVQKCFINIAREIAKRELLLIVTPEPEEVKKQIAATVNMNNVRFLECATNDTWARDHGAITMIDTGTPSLLDFTFNGWGLKFASELDNQITKHAVEAGALKGQYIDHLDFVLEGGSIESDGMGTLLTTSECLLSPQRNGRLNQVEIEEDGERLPATYANFLIMNDVILYPTYNQPANDKKAGEVLQQAFPSHQIIGIDCHALIKQHGSLHCVTMQYPLGVIKES